MDNKETNKSQIEFQHLKIINRILSNGDRVELIPVKDGVKVMQVERKEVKN